MIQAWEAVLRSAWPASEEAECDGWLLCAGGGRTRRTNSVQPLARGRDELPARIARCEDFYHARGQSTLFKLTPAAEPPELDAELSARGYRLTDPTSVQHLVLADAAQASRGREPEPDAHWQSDGAPSDAWLAACWLLNEVAPTDQPALREIFERIAAAPEPCSFLSCVADGGISAQGLGVLRGRSLCLFEVATGAGQRRRGLARALVSRMLAEGRALGAEQALLQVLADNAAAVALYAGLGFQELYRYWYREQPQAPR